METKAQKINALLAALDPFMELLKGPPVSLSERRRAVRDLAGTPDRFVSLLAQTLIDHRALFADIPVDGHKLLERQALADALYDLYAVLAFLAERTNDAFLLTQSAAMTEAMTVRRKVGLDAQNPLLDAEGRRRARHRFVAMAAVDKVFPLQDHGRSRPRKKGPRRGAKRIRSKRTPWQRLIPT